MIPFPFNENRFSFFVADHLLVSQLCTNPQSDKSLLLCLKVTQCSCSLPIQVMTTGPLPEPSKCKSGRFNAQRIERPYEGDGAEGHIMPLNIFEVGLKVNTKEYLDVLKSVVIPWCNQVAGGRSWVWQQDSAPAHKSKETQAWLQKECYDFVPFSHWPHSSPYLNPLNYFVWSYLENITNRDLPRHQSQPDRRHLPSIRRAPDGACGKGMLPVLDPYRGGD